VAIVTLSEAKAQLFIDELDLSHDNKIATYIPAAIGMVEHEIECVIYETSSEVPTDATNYITFDSLRPSQQGALKAAILMAISTLFDNYESHQEADLSANPAFNLCLRGFWSVVTG
jgi:hypothetical protein